MVVGVGLHQQHRAVRLEGLVGVFRGAHRVAHVVQAVEVTDQVVVSSRVVLGAGPGESHPVGHAAFLGALAGGVDGGRVVVETDEARGREGLGHDHGGGAMAAADVGHLGTGLQLVHHAVQGGQPLSDQVRSVARAEEAFGAAEHAGVVVAPRQRAIAAHGRDQLVLVVEERGDHHGATGDVDRRVLHRQGQCLLLRQTELSVTVLHIAGGGVGAEPLAYQACVATCLRRQLFGADRLAVGHGPVEAELLAEDDVGEHRRAAHVGYQLAHEVVEPGLVHMPVLLWLVERLDCRATARCGGGWDDGGKSGRSHGS
ncbi:hypothetical protein D3C85_1090790 [compost metagenome]